LSKLFYHLLIHTGKRPAENLDIMVLETDYSSYAMLVLKRAEKITMKLYGRRSSVYFKLITPNPLSL